MAIWKKQSETIKGERGEKTIIYMPQGMRGAWIESRKQAIPHANGLGYWMHTTYYVCQFGKPDLERYTLKDAKAAAEALMEGDGRT